MSGRCIGGSELTYSAAVICSVLMSVGLVVSACAANVGHHGLLIGGRILSGFGSGGTSLLSSSGLPRFYSANCVLCALCRVLPTLLTPP